MAKVSLRIYNREIESLVDQGNTDEAVAHCHHILRTFPKHLETYRLLGKAHLEAKRYNEAVDIFSRLLMAVPEDFVAHVGMSIIRDEQNKSDDAIWHMERAFESQPSNSAIQSELQRLYGRRDGMEPPKIRMTRGALAHMYVQGELHSQAIAEIRVVLAEDPSRSDMQVLLARSYFLSGQKADASDMCLRLLKQYPYCFDANRIMVELLQTTADAESTQVYRARIIELDPYAALAKISIFQLHEVPDAAVNLERLEYTGDDAPMGEEWGRSLGIGLLASSAAMTSSVSSDEQPDWLKSEALSVPVESQGDVPANEDIPDFLRAAGWGESKTPEQPTSIFDSEPAGSDDLVPADLPDWLKGQAPVGLEKPTEPQFGSAESLDTPDWLTELGDIQSESASPEAAQVESVEEKDAPDWLNVKTAEPVITQPDDVPDWLNSLSDSKTAEPAPAESGDAPDWLSGLDKPSGAPSEISPGELPDWLSGLDSPQTSEPSPSQSANISDLFSTPSPEVTSGQVDALPDWLDGLDELQPIQPVISTPPNIDTLGSTAQEQDDAVAWLESLAAKHGAKPEEMVSDPNKRSDTAPEWVQQAQSINQQTTDQPSVENLGTSAQEQDDAVAWLESLAAKHGAKPEELVTDPNMRTDTPPEWVQQAQAAGEAESAANLKMEVDRQNTNDQLLAELSNASTTPGTDETGMWLRNLEDVEKQDEFIAPLASGATDMPEWINDLTPHAQEQSFSPAEVPEWLKASQQASVSDNQFDFAEKEESAPQSSNLPNWLSDAGEESSANVNLSENNLNDQDLSSWLSGLDDEPGLPFESMPTPDSILAGTVKIEEPVAAKSDLPDWLNGVDSAGQDDLEEDLWKKAVEQAPPVPASVPDEEPAPVNLSADLPDWLQGVEEESTQLTELEDEGDDVPPWMHREQWESEEPQPLKPTSPSDWHPVEVEVPQPVSVPVTEQEDDIEASHKPAEQTYTAAPLAVEVSEQQVSKPAPARKKAGLSARQVQPEVQDVTLSLNQAKDELDRGDIPAALARYGKLIKKGRHLDDAIRDLSESLYRYPVEVGIWQTLGDAYMRANRLKEALESYNKAEELIR
jgi:tetratricopeptide (TPR) repeat protein